MGQGWWFGFQKNAIDEEIVLGQHARKRVFLPRISLYPSDDDDGIFPFRFKRKQFPVRLSFAMTINKAQGQTILHAGVYLPEPVFSHGQLYVALSRATARVNIKVLATIDKDKTKKHQIQRLSSVLKVVMEVASTGWNENVYLWDHMIPNGTDVQGKPI